ncbi:MAG: sigma-70 family RNA polymerase sigma factor [Akkermansia sp.]
MSTQEFLEDKTDATLVEETVAGQTRSFDELIRRHSRKLHAMLLQMLGNDSDAYDVAQEAFLKAFHSLRYFHGRSAFYTWLYAIAANQARNLLRKRKREKLYSLDNDDKGDAYEKDHRLADTSIDGDPVRTAQVKDLKTKLYEAIESLSPAHREAVALIDIQHMSYSEAAAILKVSEGTVRSRIFYAHKQLQGLLAGER